MTGPIIGDGAAALKDWSAGQAILDDFVVERELGAGGMGKVYLLRSRSTSQPFAVKRALLRDEASRRNFLAELETWINLPEHPHLIARGTVRTVNDPILGEFKIPGFPLRFSAYPEELEFDAPRLGEHNASILEEYLGYTPARVIELETSGVLHRAPY